jgi:VIT1/CCC1 family predicted Fe2+/Mn2+ transporter
MNPDYFRNLIFGAEDSLVSTVGVLFGLAISGEYSSRQIILAGLVLIVVEALSMGAGAFLSEKEVHELVHEKGHKDSPSTDGIIMFLAYFVSGFIILGHYMFFPVDTAKYYSVGISLVGLYMIGFFPTKRARSGLRMTIVAGMAILLGFIVAKAFETFI